MTTEQAGAAGIVETHMVIGGASVEAEDGRTFDVIEPHRGTLVATAPRGDEADVDRAVAAAQAAFEGDWGSMAASDRGRLLPALEGYTEVKNVFVDVR